MRAVVVRRGQQRQKGPEKFHGIATVECDKCDAEYVISHKRKSKRSPSVAAEQASQLKATSTEDHGPKDKREHPDLVEFEWKHPSTPMPENVNAVLDIVRHDLFFLVVLGLVAMFFRLLARIKFKLKHSGHAMAPQTFHSCDWESPASTKGLLSWNRGAITYRRTLTRKDHLFYTRQYNFRRPLRRSPRSVAMDGFPKQGRLTTMGELELYPEWQTPYQRSSGRRRTRKSLKEKILLAEWKIFERLQQVSRTMTTTGSGGPSTMHLMCCLNSSMKNCVTPSGVRESNLWLWGEGT